MAHHYKVEGRGSGAIAERLFKPLAAEWTCFSLVSTELVTEGETVASLGDFKDVRGATGKTFNARYAQVGTMENGKITCCRQYVDTLAVADSRRLCPTGSRGHFPCPVGILEKAKQAAKDLAVAHTRI